MIGPLNAVPAFDVLGPLPVGTTVLEASAGTGKTFTIAALVTRLIAEGEAALDQMLIVTFSRAATGELRERVRERLTSAERRLADPQAALAGHDDPLVQLLAEGSDETVALRRRRLGVALTTFDAATIATTHQFCSQVLAGLGVTSQLAGADHFTESLDTLVEQAVDDLYLRKFAVSLDDGMELIPHGQAREIARDVFADPQARLEPVGAPADSPAGQRRRLAEAVRSEVDARKRRRGVRSYDDLQTDLARVLAHPVEGPAACRRLQERFRAVLIDEFQDTDPVQWEIVERAFVGATRVVLIGDPKQAIYGFRGADVSSYLQAAQAADHVATLERNWRSEPGLLRGFDALFGSCTFGDPDIAYRVVQAARNEDQLRGAPVAAPLRLRVLARAAEEPLSPKGFLMVDRLRPRIAGDVAADIVRLLESGAQVLQGDAFAPVQPGDVAVLVRTNAQANLVRDALRARGVPAVIGGASSVFTTPVGHEWLILLEALEQPHRAGRVKAAAMTCFLAWSAERLAVSDPSDVDALAGVIRGWAGVLSSKGVAALLEMINVTQGLPARLLSDPDGERRLTDLRHIGEALHGAAIAEGLGITALVAWLRARIDEADEAVDGILERTRRLDSDADAVQVVTIHRSKGLEFPIVYVPFGWDQYRPDVIKRPRYHDASGHRVLDVGGGLGGSDLAAHSDGVLRHRLEEAGEQLRLLYVAVTRARSQAVLWWAPATTAECAPLSRLIFGSEAGGAPAGEPAMSVAIPADDAINEGLQALAVRAPGDVVIEAIAADPISYWDAMPASTAQLRTADFDRALDTTWRRTSYSGLTAMAHEAGASTTAAVSSEPEEGALDDEPVEETPLWPAGGGAAGAGEVVSPMATLPGGTAFGSLVHAVLEVVDPGEGELQEQIREAIADQLLRWGSAGSSRTPIDAEVLADSLTAVFESPLGLLARDARLADFTSRDRLTEMNFELPLAGGDEPGVELRLGALGPVLAAHLEPGDPLAAYSERLSSPLLRDQPLRGFLNGSLDAILRVAGEVPRYVVVDYKTNWLSEAAAGSGQLTAADYTPARMADSMLSSDYPLQALLYSVALHRYLRWRQPGYDPAVHLGGVLYLYLRGMCGPQTPTIDGQPCGVFAWRPPAGLVTALSDLLDSGRVSP